jgi:2-C-methyl-D-erythritol 4-phosphate cytidylyltransferase
MKVWAIIVAAGAGTRFGAPKHAVRLNGVELWRRGRDALLAGGADAVIVVGDVPQGIPGGARRRDSVAAGLRQVPTDVEIVLVHDAARPLASPELVRRVIDRLVEGDADAVVPALPVRDTVKLTLGDEVVRTVDRSHLVSVQTPQAFRTDVLRRAHGVEGGDATDDASMVEELGASVVTVAGESRNLKVTFPEDLALLQALQAMGGE